MKDILQILEILNDRRYSFTFRYLPDPDRPELEVVCYYFDPDTFNKVTSYHRITPEYIKGVKSEILTIHLTELVDKIKLKLTEIELTKE